MVNTYLNQQSITIQRQTYVANKSTFATIASNVRAYVRQLDSEQALLNDIQAGKGFFVMVDLGTDVQDGDKVIWESVTYEVKGVASHRQAISMTPFKSFAMVLPQDD